MGISCKNNEQVEELMRVIRFNIAKLLDFESDEDLKMMTLGVAHGLSRYKLKFSAEKVDIMIIQAVSLLEDLDKEINNYTMRLKEWFGWHFPEMAKIVTDNLIYTKVVKAIGMREKTSETDLSGILPEDIEKDVKEAA
jgi:nucleolar protein 58